jgi:hypothetical protein
MIRGSSKTSASSEAPSGRRALSLAVLVFYGLAAAGDFAYHMIEARHGGNQAVELFELPVAFSAALFWPLDLVAMALLPRS